jgi:hypothetical protein
VANRRQQVQPPSFTPLPYGLLSVIQTPAADDGHWQNGITYQARCAITMGAGTYDECISVTGTGNTPAPPTKTETHELLLRGATPFTVYADFECSTVGSLADSQQIAEQALAQSGSWQVERAFWAGTVAGQMVVYPHLAAAIAVTGTGTGDSALMQTVPVTGGPFDVAEALGFLEQQLADCYNGVGVIHIPVEALPTFDAWGLVKVQGNRLKTLNGNWVAVGAGYPGTSPAGADPAAGTTWIYATGAVFGYTGDVRVTDQTSSINRSENTVTRIAERTHVLGWDCCHAGAVLTLGVATS